MTEAEVEKMRHDLDLRILSEHNTDLRHSETVSLAAIAAFLAATMVYGSQVYPKAGTLLQFVQGFWMLGVFGGSTLFSIGWLFRQRQSRAEIAVAAIAARVNQRLGRSTVFPAELYLKEADQKVAGRWYGDPSLPHVCLVMGCGLLGLTLFISFMAGVLGSK